MIPPEEYHLLTAMSAKARKAVVTGVCSTRNVEQVRSVGADHVIDYRTTDFTRTGQHYDVVFDLVGNRSMGELRALLTPDGTLVVVFKSGQMLVRVRSTDGGQTWEPPEPISIDTVEPVLTSGGARPWQVELTVVEVGTPLVVEAGAGDGEERPESRRWAFAAANSSAVNGAAGAAL